MQGPWHGSSAGRLQHGTGGLAFLQNLIQMHGRLQQIDLFHLLPSLAENVLDELFWVVIFNHSKTSSRSRCFGIDVVQVIFNTAFGGLVFPQNLMRTNRKRCQVDININHLSASLAENVVGGLFWCELILWRNFLQDVGGRDMEFSSIYTSIRSDFFCRV